MASPRSNLATEMKTASQLWAEEEARVEIARARAEIEARRALKAKSEEEIWGEAALEKARAKAHAAVRAREEEEARIDASGKDEWFYTQNDAQCGPVTLEELRGMIADLSIEPPVKMVWAEGMEGWKPVYEVRRVCESDGSPELAAVGGTAYRVDSESSGEITGRAVEVALIQGAAKAEVAAKVSSDPAVGARTIGQGREKVKVVDDSARKEEENARIAAAEKVRQEEESTRLRVEAEARLKAAEEARASAEAKATAESALRVAAEAMAAVEAKNAAEILIRAQEEHELRIRSEKAAQLKAFEETRLRNVAEEKALKERNLREAAELRALDESRRREAAEAKAAETARIAAENRAKAEREARAKAEIEAKAAEDARLRSLAEAKAAEAARVAAENRAKAEREARAKAEFEAKVAEEARLRIVAEAKAAETARVAAESRVKAEREARAKAELEAKEAEEAKIRILAEAKAAETARVAAENRAKAEREARAKAELEAKEAEEAKLRIVAEAKAAETARVAAENRAAAQRQASAKAEAEAKAAEEAKAREEIEALAAEEARIAAVARERAMIKARAAEEARIAAPARRQARREKRARALENAKLRMQARNMVAGVTETAVVSDPAHDITPAPVAKDNIGKSQAISGAASPRSNENVSFKTSSGRRMWFYTCEGERLGPVGFEELRSMALASALDPRLDMVWKKDMNEWKPAGKIDGLFERRGVPAGEGDSPAPEAKSRRPAAKAATHKNPRNPGEAPWPGALRRSLLLAAIVFPLVWHFALVAAGPFLVKQLGPAVMAKVLPIASLVPLVVLVHFSLSRLVNLGMSRWWYLAMFAPLINLWLCYRCFACPPGYAYYRKMDAPGAVLAILYWLVVLAGLYVIASAGAPLLAGFETVELTDRIRSAIQNAATAAGRP